MVMMVTLCNYTEHYNCGGEYMEHHGGCYIFRYTEHSTVGLAQQWDQLDQLCMRMQHNLEQQIEARNRSGVSEDALREFSMMFK